MTPGHLASEMSPVSVLICTHSERRWDQLEQAIGSVRAQTRQADEVVVVVDHNARLLQRLREHFSGVQVLSNQHEPGLAGCRNTGVAAASGFVVAFLDDDARALPDWLELLTAPFEQEGVVGVGGSVVPVWASSRPRWFPEEFDWVVGCTHSGMPSQRGAVRNFVGANMAFRRAAVHEVGFFSGIGHAGGKPLGGSDPDICIRVQQRFPDQVLLYEPAARVFHHVTEQRATARYFARRCFNEGTAKALLTARLGAGSALSSERAYVVSTLPRAIGRALRNAGSSGDPRRLAPIPAIVFGLTLTAAGYSAGLVRRAVGDVRGSRRSPSRFAEG
jgi:glycosyltransferase involved in cell wall biosynthesis